MTSPAAVAERVGEVRDRIVRAGGDLDSVTLVAVTKGFGREAVDAARQAGVCDVAESYAQELVAKAGDGGSSADDVVAVRWHFVGRLQSNKIARLAPVVACWQSVDRSPLVVQLARRAPGARVLVQVNITASSERGGCAPAEVPVLVAQARRHGLEVCGLMAVGPPGPPEGARSGFRRVVTLADDLELPVRSLGMSADLEVAIEEGSTMVRVGRALFGRRPSGDLASPQTCNLSELRRT